MLIRLRILKWNVQIEPEPSKGTYHQGFDGRLLYLSCNAENPGDLNADWQVSLRPVVDSMAKKRDGCGFLSWISIGGIKGHFQAVIGLQMALWHELWTRSAHPPSSCVVWFEIDWDRPLVGAEENVLVSHPIVHMISP